MLKAKEKEIKPVVSKSSCLKLFPMLQERCKSETLQLLHWYQLDGVHPCVLPNYKFTNDDHW